MQTCGRCRRDLTPGALFCASCGAPVPPLPGDDSGGDPFIGQTFRGVYFVQQKVGGGGMGQVYKGQHIALQSTVAIKILKKALLADPAVVERFQREARAASRLRHRNVIAVTDFGQADDGTLFMVMEYVAGKSLAQVIAGKSPLPEPRIVHIGEQILAALVEAHADGILHRDLKPENVMLESRRGERDLVKVLDFGIAKILEPGAGHRTLTQEGLVCGTPGYMSPEQWEGTELDARSDLYAVGVILYEMLTGELPVEGRTPLELARKHLVEKPVPPSTRCPGRSFSPELEALVMRVLSVDRTARPADAEEMRRELLACALLPSTDNAEREDTLDTVVIAGEPAEARAAPLGAPTVLPPGARPAPPPVRRTPARTAQRPGLEPPPAAAASRRNRLAIGIGSLVLVVAATALVARSLMGREPGPGPAAAASTAPVAGSDAPPPRPAPTSPMVPPSPPPPGPAVSESREVLAPAPVPPPARPKDAGRSREPLEIRDALNAIATPAPSTGQGVLSVQVEPFGDVIVDGRPYGEAPKEFRLRAGSVVVVATHPQLGRRQERIEILPGKRTTRTFSFSPP